MAFFKKKNKKTEPAAESASKKSSKPDAPVVKKNKKKSAMASLFHTSVFETVLTELEANESFHVTGDDGDGFIGLALDVATIGGLDKRSKKDESKGSLIECINSGKIGCYITDELLEANLLVFLPTKDTLTNMDEFSMLTKATFELCKIDRNGDIDLLGKTATYDEVVDIYLGHKSINAQLGLASDEDEDVFDDDDSDLLDDEESEKSEDISDDDFTDDAEDVDDDIDYADNVEPVQDMQPMDEPAAPQMPDMGAGAGNPEPMQGAYQEQPQQPSEQSKEEVAIPDELVHEAQTRHFYSSDLDLEVTTEPFDSVFMHENGFTPFETERLTDATQQNAWLNAQLNEMARGFNEEMSRLHANNLFLMRKRYYKLMSLQCDRIIRDMDIYNETTQYGQLYKQLQEEQHISTMELDAKVNRKKQELETRWVERLKAIGMDAARAAQHDYKEKYQRQHERELEAVESTVSAMMAGEYEDKKRELLSRRRTEARTLLDISITETLDEISDMYLAMVEREHIRYAELQKTMDDFKNDNLQYDIQRIRALTEEQRQVNLAEQAKAEANMEITQLRAEFDEKRTALVTELEDMRRENQRKIDECNGDAQRKVERAKDAQETAEKRYSELLQKYQELDKAKEEKYRKTLDEKSDEIQVWKERTEHIEEVHKRSNLMATFLIIAIAIAAVSIGFIGGEWSSANRNTKEKVNQYVQEMSQNNQQNQNDEAADADAAEDKAE